MADDVRLLLVSFIVENLDVLEFSLELIAEPMVTLGNKTENGGRISKSSQRKSPIHRVGLVICLDILFTGKEFLR